MVIKLFAILFFITSTAAIPELLDPLGEGREKCRKQTGLTKEQLAGSKHHIEKIANYLLCLAKQFNALDQNGSIDEDTVVNLVASVVQPTISRPIVQCCNYETMQSGAKTPAERIVAYVKCAISKVPTVILNLTGLLKKPVYPYLDTCEADRHGR